MNDAMAPHRKPIVLSMYLLGPALVTRIVTVSEACLLVFNCLCSLGKVPSKHPTK